MSPEQLTAAVQAFLAEARAKAAGGITVAEFGDLVVGLLRLVVAGLDTITSLDGPAKKAWALAAVASLFDTVADKAVPLWLWPAWLVLRPAVRALVLAAAGGALEQVLILTRGLERTA